MFKKQSKSKQSGVIDKTLEERQNNGLYGLWMMFLGAVLAIALGAFFYLSPFFNKKTSPALNAPVEVVPIEETTKENETTQEYRFYEILPKQEFESPPEGASLHKPKDDKPAQLPVDQVVEAPASEDHTQIQVVEDDNQTYEGKIELAKPTSTYILQVRTYEDADEADQKRAEVMMAGVDAEVVKRFVENGVLYQVVSSTMNSKDEAMDAYQKLQSNGIDSVVVEQRH